MVSFNALVPELSVADIKRTKAFYLDILGFVLEYERLQDGFVFMSYGAAQMMFE